MNSRKNILYLAICLLPLFFSCKKKVLPPPDMKYSYFPTNVGHWVIYDVDSLYHNDYDCMIHPYHFQIKEIITEEFYDAQGRLSQRIERYTRSSDTSSWKIRNVWTSNLTKTTAERTEENQRYVKLIYPPAVDKSWNGNSFNTIGEWGYQYSSVDEPSSDIVLNFDSTLTVEQTGKNDPLIYTQHGKEVYAKNVGLIYKEQTDLRYNTTRPTGCDSGSVYKITLVSYSK